VVPGEQGARCGVVVMVVGLGKSKYQSWYLCPGEPRGSLFISLLVKTGGFPESMMAKYLEGLIKRCGLLEKVWDSLFI
jgi:hypothetical protein